MGNNKLRKGKDYSVGLDRRWVIILAVVSVAVVLGGLFLVARFLDNRMNRLAIERDTFADDDYYLANTYTYARGTLELAACDFDYFHNFDNYLIIGTDYSGNEEAEGEDFQNSMADFLLLMCIDKTEDSYTLLELNRDTITTIPVPDGAGDGEESYREMQLCTAHWYGSTKEEGCQNQVKAVSMMLGELPINGYYSISLRDIPKMNQAMGGVTVTIQNDDLVELDPALKKGATVTLTDEQAYIFLQRRMDVGEGLNTERMARQHQYLEAFLQQGAEKAKTVAAANYFYDVFDSLNTFAITDLTGKQISRIAKALTSDTRKGLYSFEGRYELNSNRLGDGLEHYEFFVDDASLCTVMTKAYGLIPQEGEEDSAYEIMRGKWLPEWGKYEYRGEDMSEWASEYASEQGSETVLESV